MTGKNSSAWKAISAVAAICFAAACSFWRPHVQNSARRSSSARTDVEPMYYMDLGPSTIDVSSYPPRQQANYKIAAQVCGSCHTFARTVNSPLVRRMSWTYTVSAMRILSRFKPSTSFSRKQEKAIVDFLVYDGQARKLRHPKQFEDHIKDLQNRFDDLVSQRMQDIQRHFPQIPSQ